MGVLNWLVRRVVRHRLRQVQKASAAPAATQEQLLLDFVRRAAHTQWGRDHGYGSIRSVHQFQRAVPLSRYEDQAPWWHRAFDGARDVTWPGHIPYFALSSGTTAGASKALPISRAMLRANRRSALTLMGLIERQVADADPLAGRTFYLGGCTELERRGACWQGDASGINARCMPRLAWRFRLPEPDVAAIGDWERRLEAICQRYLQSPVAVLVGLPSWTLLLFRRLIDVGRERLGSQVSTVADLWPELCVFVSFGMAFEPYRRQLRELVGRPVAIVDTYCSSEGGLNAIQSEQGDSGMLLELDGGAVYEFVPLAELDSNQPPRLTLDQVEPDVPYAVLLSTCSGIWAYDVGDAVRFTSLRPPKIVFASRTQTQLNVFGEHVIQENLDAAMAAACEATGAQVRDFTVTSVPPTSEDPRGGHRWLVEFDGSPPPLEPFARHLDAALGEASADYAAHREGDVAMRAPEVVVLTPGTFYAWADRHEKLGGQHKVPRVAPSDAMADEIQSLSKSLSA
jgi:hypothetical protein